MIKSKLTGTGISPFAALSIGCTVTNAIVAAGATLASATPLGDDINVVTVATANQGVSLRGDLTPGDNQKVVNYTAVSIIVYPATALGKISNGVAGAGLALAPNKVARFICIDGVSFAALVSA